MSVDPKFTFWFGVWTNVLALLAGYSLQHAPEAIAQFAPDAQWCAGVLVQVNSVILTALAGISSSKPGPLVSVPPGVIKPIVVLAIMFAALFAFGGDAHAQARKPQFTGNIVADTKANLAPKAAATTGAPTGLAKFMSDLANLQKTIVDNVVADITAADADAATLTNPGDPASFRDPIAHACYPAAVKFLTELPVSTAPTGTLVGVQLFQKKRDFIMQIQAGLPTYLKLGCAPLLGDEAQVFTKLMGLVGINVALNTLIPGAGALSALSF
ncbi:hypothetical protein SAMN05216337_1017158 [Bradyrhizobium brasilense]|uniref:Uncharacterized protein n=1 Tax=Bradyrhizobium brasilense TaxID=1419277 RepID=A0A1G6Z266_9BRAD|nr:hypothetical protein [Bradyrhizobium brasilense]SDD95906.1 hypothetical protein SAMN05216337_1017158 [Bradyrhizobium brasilense]